MRFQTRPNTQRQQRVVGCPSIERTVLFVVVVIAVVVTVVHMCFFITVTFDFPAELAGDFTLIDLLDKPWSQV